MVANSSRNEATIDWTANWIWCEGEGHPKNSYIYARKAVKLPAKPVQAILRITADSRYKLFVNGNYVGWGPVNSLTRRLSYDTYDITQFLNRGTNSIAVVAYHLGYPASNYVPRRAALICEADIEWKSGGLKVITDDTWRVIPAAAWTSAGARVSRNLGFQEVYDAKTDVDGWTEAKFNDAKWQAPVVLGTPPMPPFGRLSEREIPDTVEQIVRPSEIVGIYESPELPEGIAPQDIPVFMASEELKPLTLAKVDKRERILTDEEAGAVIRFGKWTGGVSVVLDFGRHVYGSLNLDLSKCTSGVVDIGYDEAHGDDGIKPDRDGIRYTDRVILRKGKVSWSSFEPRAFRYVQLDFHDCPKPIAVDQVFVRDLEFPIAPIGEFDSSDSTLNRVWQEGAEAVRRFLVGAYIDTPWKDQTLGLPEILGAIKPAYYSFGRMPFLDERLRHITDFQRRDGALFGLHPDVENRLFIDLALIWVMVVWENFVYGGDKDLLADLYPTIDRLFRWIGRFVDDDGILGNVRGDLFLDWGGLDRHGESCGLNCLYLGAILAGGKIATAINRTEDSEEFGRVAATLRPSIGKYFWSQHRGLYSDSRIDGKLEELYSRQTNILAARYEVPDHYKKSAILRLMASEPDMPEVSSPLFTLMLAESISRSGYVDQAIGFLVHTWDREGDDRASHMPPPIHHLQAYILGVSLTDVAGRVRIEPNVLSLSWASGVVPTPFGPVKARWEIGPRGFAMEFEIPEGVVAEVVPPDHSLLSKVVVNGEQRDDHFFEVGPGFHRMTIGKNQRSRRPKAVAEIKEAIKSEPIPVPPGRGDIETVEQMIQILAQMEKEQLFVVDQETGEVKLPARPVGEETRRPARRRGRRGRDRDEEQRPVAAPSEAAGTEETEAGEPSVEPEEMVAGETAAEEPGRSKRRRRRRRGGRGQESAAGEEQAAETVEPVAAETEVEEATEIAPETAGEEAAGPRRRSRRRRRRSGRSAEGGAPTEGSTEHEQAPEPEPIAAPQESAEAGPTQERRPRSRRRRSGRGGEPQGPAEEPQAQPAPAQEPEPVAAQQESAEPQERRPRSRRRRSGRGQEPQSPAEEPQAQPAPAPEPEPVAATEEPQGERRPRRRRRRPSRGHEGSESGAPQAESVPSPEPVAKPVEAPAPTLTDTESSSNGQPPKRRRRRPPAKPREEGSPAVQPAGEAPKPEPVAPSAEPVAEKPKRRTRRPRKPAEGGSAPEGPAEG